MNIKSTSPIWNWTFKQFNAAPFILRIYLVFSVVITIANILLLVVNILLLVSGRALIWSKIVPTTGWLPSLGYMFSLFFSFAIIFANPLVINKIKMRSAIIKILGIGILYGIISYLLNYGNNSQNSYTQASALQPYFTMGLPVFWIILLMLPQITKFCEQKNS